MQPSLTNEHHEQAGVEHSCVEALAGGDEGREGPEDEGDEQAPENGLTDPRIAQPQLLRSTAGRCRGGPSTAVGMGQQLAASCQLGAAVRTDSSRIIPAAPLPSQGTAARHTCTHRQVLESNVTQRLCLRLVHAVRQLREDAVHVLEERAKKHLLPPRLEQRQLRLGRGGDRRGSGAVGTDNRRQSA